MPPLSHEPHDNGSPYGTDDPDLGGFGNFHGDFYREPDDVTRGVSMAAPPGPMDYKGIGDNFYVDYQEPDDLLTGLPVGMSGFGGAGGAYGGPHFGSKELAGGIFDPGCMDSCAHPFKTSFGDNGFSNAQGTLRFPETAVPPCVPDPLYIFDESTTLHVTLGKKFEPSKIGNDMLDFLEERMGSSILKVNTRKFAIKANVFVDGRMCTLKAKVFSEGNYNYALEVQRRSGDALTFVAVYQQAAKYLQEEKLYEFAAGREVSLSEPQAAPALPPMDVEHDLPVAPPPPLAPLLDLAGLEELPSLQAEAAVAFAGLASEPDKAAALCCDPAFETILALLQQGEEIAYPTTQALLHLTKCHEAKPWLSKETLLLSIVKEVSSKASCPAVRTELAKVVDAAVQCCLDCLTATVKEQLANELVKAADELKGPEAQASQHLIYLARSKLVQY